MSRRALFLDRDGVINRDDDFVHRAEDFHFLPGIFPLVRGAIGLGYAPIVVTNQSGIARGLFTEAQYLALNQWMLERFSAEGARITATYHCPYLPVAAIAQYRHPNHPWRKPAPGMLLAARDDLGVELTDSVLIGDRWSDVQAGVAAGLTRLALLGQGADVAPPDPPAVTRLVDLDAALSWLRSLSAA
jgi:D-glycero-D-manno-heptose 1,7-bisphosphate phosphatase